MKKNILFILFILLVFVVMYFVNKTSPQKFRWEATYENSDRQPYGAHVLDKMLEASWNDLYIHSYDDIIDLYYAYVEDSAQANVLIVCDDFYTDEDDIDYLLAFVKKGGNVLIAADRFDYALMDTLAFKPCYYSDYWPINLSIEQKEHISVSFVNPSLANSTIGKAPKALISKYFCFKENKKTVFDEPYVLAIDENDKALMINYKIGNGNLILSCTPLLFTNYTILSDSLHPFIWNSMAYLDGRPLIRTEHYMAGNDFSLDNKQGVFRYLLEQPSLRWAFYISLVAILLFMIFTTRRKQKLIPVIAPPQNRMLEFVHSISALYLSQGNNTDIIKKKYIFWADEIKGKYGIDILNEEHNEAFFQRFAAKTGMPLHRVKSIFRDLDRIMRFDMDVSDEDMINMISKMKI